MVSKVGVSKSPHGSATGIQPLHCIFKRICPGEISYLCGPRGRTCERAPAEGGTSGLGPSTYAARFWLFKNVA
jgi:hypothetical protein